MFYELALTYQDTLLTYQPFSLKKGELDCTNLSSALQREIISLGEKHLTFAFHGLSATSFMAFTRTGNRVDYEELYFNKRRALNALVMAECIEKSGRFMDSIINGIFSLCEESAWQLPAHNSYIRDTPQLILPDSDFPVLDLFACETGALLATISYLLGKKLNQISATITKRIESELQKRILTPYLTTHFWWMGNGDEPMCNWTIWCTQNILITAFLSPLSSQNKQKIFLKACQSIDFFLKDYGEDGCCDEGAQYYRHAGLCLFNAMEVLNSVTNNHFYTLYSCDKIKNMALYILNVHVDDEYYINFADCSPIAGRAGAREFLFGKRILDRQLMKFAAQDFKSDPNPLLPMEINLFYRIQSALTQDEMRSYDTSGEIIHKDIYYESVGLFKAHDNTTCLAVKSGDNNDSHNHNDTGSFTIYKNKRPLFIDVGVESYSKKTFSAKRYEIWTMQSSYHNLPEIDSTMQKDGKQYKAIHVNTKIEKEIALISMDISPAYPLNNVEYYNRSVSLIRNKYILIEDSWAGCKHVVSNLMTYEKPSITSNELFFVGDLASVHVSGAKEITVEEIPITDKRLQGTWKHEIYRIQITAKHDYLTLQIN
ncbi:heparinase II/III domain-containing protein [Candidatus Galacturonibacter soehngenii]|uniref:Heparinase n=1 Tax=Candidatus Galacturonatibacter soehngenii TaxID=2307010 RepID=A0A7V7UAC4_9FIRM|nr:heparinase II/III family protein [Candidatus Galacturonibacter soehngenii]KAB1434456.1 heparinase [Candidatus Galacturonibacter soehngenii]